VEKLGIYNLGPLCPAGKRGRGRRSSRGVWPCDGGEEGQKNSIKRK